MVHVFALTGRPPFLLGKVKAIDYSHGYSEDYQHDQSPTFSREKYERVRTREERDENPGVTAPSPALAAR